MNNTLRITLITLGALAIGAVLLTAGFFVGRSAWIPGWAYPGGMMSGFESNRSDFAQMPFGPMMGQDFNPENYDFAYPYGGMMGGGMMGNDMMGSGMMGGGMMSTSPLLDADPLSLETATTAVEDYIALFDESESLEIGEIMIFDNHAYAQIVESDTGIGALEVLVDPLTESVFPEFGPTMMWNVKYGMMSNTGEFGMMGGSGMMGMMGSFSTIEATAEMPVSEDQAVEAAQSYLDNFLPGTEADEHADPFYGYYTLHILRDGETVGMLSVNGYTRQVFIHTWHGDLVEMSAE
ncbi:MAG: hypothetical protein DWQ07_18015 [Chloroflexi bacterium]|nr:MAG: hypothetical protein DWQ07_18015 [Chloroflexota bacterium]